MNCGRLFGYASAMSNAPEKKGKKGKARVKKVKAPKQKPSQRVQPTNVTGEKAKFFSSGEVYDPQFTYSDPDVEGFSRKYLRSSEYLSDCETILNHAVATFGSWNGFISKVGGRVLSDAEIKGEAEEYVRSLGLPGVDVEVAGDMAGLASISGFGGQVGGRRPRVRIRAGQPEGMLASVLASEVGTQAVRAYNESRAPWAGKRAAFRLAAEKNDGTSAGLAALNEALALPTCTLFRPALLYYAVWRAGELSFSALSKDLSKFVDDPEMRWNLCLRAKRGLCDTSKPGGYARDQQHLQGALALLDLRDQVDFAMLYAGKVSLADARRLHSGGLITQSHLLPPFLTASYPNALQRILADNGLSSSTSRGEDVAAAALFNGEFDSFDDNDNDGDAWAPIDGAAIDDAGAPAAAAAAAIPAKDAGKATADAPRSSRLAMVTDNDDDGWGENWSNDDGLL